MNLRRTSSAAIACAGLLSSCVSTLDETDRHAFFADVRVRKELEGEADHDGMHFELGGNLVDGDTDELDYTISTVALGFGVDRALGEKGWGGVVAGFGWMHTDFDTTPIDLDAEDNYGPYIAVQGGWTATDWLEPYARADLGMYFPDFGTTFGVEAGARFHFIEHTSLFVGWRYKRLDISDLDNLIGIDDIELDLSGLVVGLELSF